MSWSLTDSNKQAIFIASVALLILSTVLRFIALNQTHYANGWDGYYYVMQAHSWLTYGHLQSTDYSLIYPYFTLLSGVLNDYILAYKWGASLLAGLLVFSAFRLVFAYTLHLHLAILVAAYLIFSPTITYLISQFPKNVLGLIFLIEFASFVWQRKWVWSLTFLLLTLMTHRMTAGLALIMISIYALSNVSWKWIIGVGLVVILLSFLPGVIHLSDFKRFSGQFSMPQFAPWSLYATFQNSMSTLWVIEMLILAILIVSIPVLFMFRFRQSKSDLNTLWMWTPAVLILIFPFFIFESGSIGYRFFLIVPVILSIYIIQLRSVGWIYSYALAAIFLAASFFSYKSYNPAYHDPPNQLYEIVIEGIEQNYDHQAFDLVVAHKSLAEMIIYKTEFDALNWAPDSGLDHERVLRVIKNLDAVHLRKYLNEEEFSHFNKLTLHYYITTEAYWRRYLYRVNKNEDKAILERITNGSNPMQERPDFLTKGKDL